VSAGAGQLAVTARHRDRPLELGCFDEISVIRFTYVSIYNNNNKWSNHFDEKPHRMSCRY